MSLLSSSFPVTIDTSSADIIADFFVPALSESVKYDRGVGYFSAGWLRLTAQGMSRFASNGGRARWVTSPILSEDDWHALQRGAVARHDSVIRAALERNVKELAWSLEEDTLSALAWMVADEILDFRIAVPRNKLNGGDFHDKFGIFTDLDGNKVSFIGSYNETVQGTFNYESIRIFPSWFPPFEAIVNSDFHRFERLWNNLDPNVQVFDLPAAARENILKLRTEKRPYQIKPEGMLPVTRIFPSVPKDILPRSYQSEAINAWFENNCCGLLEMATGTGKTLTALIAAVKVFEKEKRLALLIAVPFQHLVDQWAFDLQKFGFAPLLAYGAKNNWIDEWNKQIVEYNSDFRKTICIVTTYKSFSSTDFQDSISRILTSMMFIADEAHHLGAESLKQVLPKNPSFKLALSATPDRWFDEMGSQAIREYFCRTVYEFPLERAIGVTLTPYYYFPILVPLNDDELEAYKQLSQRIARVIGKSDVKNQQKLRILLTQRADLLNNADSKLTVLSDLIDQQTNISHTLFYCSPNQIDAVAKLLGVEKGLQIRRFTAKETPKERQTILKEFGEGELKGLVAMKCLDEGVDVPSTQVAYILASSSNPREFIQRRGRILRRYPGKEFSIIYDLIAVPDATLYSDRKSETYQIERSILRRELQRFQEFANLAINKHQAIDVVWQLAKQYSLLDF